MRTSGCLAVVSVRTLSGDPNTSGSDADRVSSADHPDARWFNAGAFQNPGAGAVWHRAAHQSATHATSSGRISISSIAKDTRFGGNHTAQIRFEILNLTNTREVQRVVGRKLGRSLELRPHHIAARVHADLAAQFPLHVLKSLAASSDGYCAGDLYRRGPAGSVPVQHQRASGTALRPAQASTAEAIFALVWAQRRA